MIKKLLVGLSLVVTTHAFADVSVCENVADCEKLREQADAQLIQLQAGPLPKFLEVSKERMKHAAAAPYCTQLNAHVPSSRELARLAMSLGAQTILDKTYVDKYMNGQAPKDYRLISAQNTDGKIENFYYNENGYKNSKKMSLWSSSTIPDYPKSIDVLYNDGSIQTNFPNVHPEIERQRFVRCVSDQ
jgi:hypothetical protein